MLKTTTGQLVRRLCTPLTRASTRNTVIVKRVYQPPLVVAPHRGPLEIDQRVIDQAAVDADDDKYLVYELEEKAQQQETVKVILLRAVDDYGVRGQIVSFPSVAVYRDLILPGLAVYYSEAAAARHAAILIPETTRMNSSETARLFAMKWSKRVLDVCLSMDHPWTVEPWHVKASLRKHRVWAEDEHIEIPGGAIHGPNLDLENKEFVAILTINNLEKVKLRCRIHHHTFDADRQISLPSWYFRQAEPVWEAERQTLLDMNRQPPSYKLRTNTKLAPDMAAYKQWKSDRLDRLH